MTAAPANAPRRARMRWPYLLTALLLGSVLAALLVEGAFRLFWTLPPWFQLIEQAGMFAATADGDVALRPGYEGEQTLDGRTTAIAVDRLGLRVGAAAAPAGGRRILMVGDSLVFGYGVAGDETLPARTEQALRAAGMPATVGNAGVPGHGSRHAAAQLQRLDGPFGADAFVFCSFLGNDAVDDAITARTVYAGLMLQGPVARLVRTSWRTRLAFRSRAALWFEAWVLNNKPEWSPLHQAPPDPEEQRLTAGLPADGQRHAGLFLDVVDLQTSWVAGAPPPLPPLLAVLQRSLQQAQRAAGTRPLVYVVLPTLWQVDEGRRVAHLQQLGLDPAKYERGLAQQRWRQIAAGLGLPVLDATPILAAEPRPEELFLTDGGHLSVRGNEVVGRWLAAELARLLR